MRELLVSGKCLRCCGQHRFTWNWTWQKRDVFWLVNLHFFLEVSDRGLEFQLLSDQLKGGAFCVCYSAKDTVTLHPTTPMPPNFYH